MSSVSTDFPSPSIKRQEPTEVIGKLRLVGSSMLEIFHVRLDRTQHWLDADSPVAIYGDISVTDSLGSVTLWARPPGNPVSIHPGEDIPLEGPSRRLIAHDEVCITLDIRAVESGTIHESIIITNRRVAFNPRRPSVGYGIKTDTEDNVTVFYMTIRDALAAEISIALLDGCGSFATVSFHLYGTISANNGHGNRELFRKAKVQYVSVPPNSHRPLCKGVVAVPVDDKLRLDVELFLLRRSRTAGPGVDSDSDESVLLVKERVELELQRGRTQEKVIGEGEERVLVKVSCSGR